MSNENLNDDFKHRDLETILSDVSWQPKSGPKSHLMYECGKAAALAEFQAERSRTNWLRVAAVAVAIVSGVMIGRFTDTAHQRNEHSAIAVHDEPTGTVEPSRTAPKETLLFLAGDTPSKIPTETRAGMTMAMLQTKFDQPRPAPGHPEIIDANRDSRTKAPVWSAGPFTDLLRVIDI